MQYVVMAGWNCDCFRAGGVEVSVRKRIDSMRGSIKMETREKLIRLLPVFFNLLTMLIILGFVICPQVFNSVLYLIVPFIGAFASRYYCVMKYPYKPKWERNFRVLILTAGLITLLAVIGYLVWTLVM